MENQGRGLDVKLYVLDQNGQVILEYSEPSQMVVGFALLTTQDERSKAVQMIESVLRYLKLVPP